MTPESPNQTTLGSDVFVSYASQDAAVANSIVESLESQGLKCWIAPRDVKPGAQYADAIVRAINEAKAVVLVMSGSAVDSAHVAREVERAASKRKPIIAFRIDAAALNPELEYFLSNAQWIDVKALGMPAALAKLKEAVGQGSATSSPGIPAEPGSRGEGASGSCIARGGRGRVGRSRLRWECTFGVEARCASASGGSNHRQIDCGAAVRGHEREEGSGVFRGWHGGGDHRSSW